MFVPYKVDVAMERAPFANWILIALTAVISLAMFGPLEERLSRHRFHGLPDEVAEQLVAAGLSPDLPADSADETTVVDRFLLQPGRFHVSQLVGNLFIHADLMHLLGNMLFLFVFGNAVNAKLGHFKYIAIYLVVGVVESLAWLAVGPRAPALGASGAIMGIVGAFLLLYPLNNVTVAYFLTFFYHGVLELSAMWVIAIYVAFDIWGLLRGGNSGVAYLAHVAGFACGALAMGLMLRWKLVESDMNEKNLLQVWGWMPFVEVSIGEPNRVSGPEARGMVRAQPHSAGPIRRRDISRQAHR